MKKSNKIIFYAPIGNLAAGFKIGGAEAGCRKTIEVLRKAGYDVILVEKPSKKNDSAPELALLALKQVILWFRFVFLFLFNRGAVLHVAGFYLNQLGYEWLIIRTASLLHIKSIYEIRNGGMTQAFYKGGKRYQKVMLSTLNSATGILCQGEEYMDFIREKLARDSVYYPNYIMDKYVVESVSEAQICKDKVHLVYLGRVVPSKNIGFIVEVCAELKKRKLDFHLQIIGAYEDTYYTNLQEKIIFYGLEADISFLGRRTPDEIFLLLRKQHFFIFPSIEEREGHSNSLTETMGYGIVPIVSNAGFNKRIVDNLFLVIDTFDAPLYAEKIVEIWNSGVWLSYSSQALNRIRDNFTESIVKKSLLGIYKDIFDS